MLALVTTLRSTEKVLGKISIGVVNPCVTAENDGTAVVVDGGAGVGRAVFVAGNAVVGPTMEVEAEVPGVAG